MNRPHRQTRCARRYYHLYALKIMLPPLPSAANILNALRAFPEQFAEYGCEAPQVTAQEAAQLQAHS